MPRGAQHAQRLVPPGQWAIATRHARAGLGFGSDAGYEAHDMHIALYAPGTGPS